MALIARGKKRKALWHEFLDNKRSFIYILPFCGSRVARTASVKKNTI